MEAKWKSEPDSDDYVAASSYLNLLFHTEDVNKIVDNLKKATVVGFLAKDIFRASNLSLLGVSNQQVQKDKAKIKTGDSLSPILLVRQPNLGKVIIADGYHRMCALYYYNEKAWIKCKIV